MNHLAEELRALSEKELRDQLEAARREMFNLRFQNSTNQAGNTSEIGKVRHKIARMLTILSEQGASV